MAHLLTVANSYAEGAGNVHVNLNHVPNECPFCHHTIIPKILGSYLIPENLLSGVFRCSNSRCFQVFLGYYNFEGGKTYNFSNTSVGVLNMEDFSDLIGGTSPNFVEIYNQAYTSEQFSLHQISGMGYRKALEFLIKDYLVEQKPEDEEKIKKTALGNCIKHQVTNPQIKLVASRAVVLGNDETHYVRKYEDKDISDLKILIELTVKWIEMEKMTKQYELEMPEGS